MAQAGAVIDVVRTEAGPNQFLEKIGLFVRALGGAEAGQSSLAILIANVTKSLRSHVQRFFPCCLAEDLAPVIGIDHEVLVLGHAGLSDQRFGKAMFVLNVVESVTALDAK